MKKLVVFIIWIHCFGSLFSQRAFFDKEKITVGDQCKLSIVINKDKGKVIEFPVFENTITLGVEIINRTEVLSSNDGKTLKQDYTITSFEDSLFIIPPFIIKVDGKELKTNPVKLEVVNFVPDSTFLSKLDTTQQIPLADIKGPLNTPLTFKELLARFWVVIAILFAGVLIYLLYRVMKKKRRKIPISQVMIPKIKIPAHVTAIKQLDVLKASGKHKEENLNPFYIELSRIIRFYLEERFNIPALESTTFEIIHAFEKTGFSDQEMNSKLQELLSLSDMVKFAKNNPDEYRNVLMFDYAYSFIHQTKEISEIPLASDSINPQE
jgi:hypothetical protein